MFNFRFYVTSNFYQISNLNTFSNQFGKFHSVSASIFKLRPFSQEAFFEPSPPTSNIEIKQNIVGALRRPKAKEKKTKERDRRVAVDWRLSHQYLQSQAYKDTYGQFKVWEMYRRNFSGQFFLTPFHTRANCVGEDGFISTSNPCPICRDKYLVLHYKNVLLLKQFIEPHTEKVIESRRSGLCQKKHEDLLVAIYLAKDYGTLSFTLPFKRYIYQEYYHQNLLKFYKQHKVKIEDSVLEKVKLQPEIVHEPAKTQFPNVLPFL